jgi:hypothetical protein
MAHFSFLELLRQKAMCYHKVLKKALYALICRKVSYWAPTSSRNTMLELEPIKIIQHCIEIFLGILYF